MVLAGIINNISTRVCGEKISLTNRVMLHLAFFLTTFFVTSALSVLITQNSLYPIVSISCIVAMIASRFALESSMRSIAHNTACGNSVSTHESSNVFNLSVLQSACAGIITGRFMLSLVLFNPFKLALAITIFALSIAFAISYSKSVNDNDISLMNLGLILLNVGSIVGMFLLGLTFIESALCAIAIPTFIGLAAVRIRALNNAGNIQSGSRMSEQAHSALASYIAADMFLILLNLFIYIVRLLDLMGNNRRR